MVEETPEMMIKTGGRELLSFMRIMSHLQEESLIKDTGWMGKVTAVIFLKSHCL
jgi:hypothetical protein